MVGLNGSGCNTSSPQEEARAALKNLLAMAQTSIEVSPAPAVDGEERSLRSSFRASIREAMRPPRAATQLADIQVQVQKLVDQVPAPQPAAPQGDDEEPAAPAVDLLRLAEEVPLERPVQFGRPAPRKKLYLEEQDADGLRQHVAESRRKLFSLDREVTQLTRQLKQGRSKLWTLQQDQSAVENRIQKLISNQVGQLSREVVEEQAELEERERALRAHLSDAKAQAARWYAEARQQDMVLQQERDAQKGGDAHRILAKHPAGEVFLPAFPSDNDSDDAGDQAHSDDEYDARRGGGPPPGRPGIAPAGRGPVAPDTSSDEDRPRAGGRQFRNERVSLDEDDSDASSMPSPSGESGSMSNSMSNMLEKSDEALSAMRPSPKGVGTGITVTNQDVGSDYSDDIEEELETSRSL